MPVDPFKSHTLALDMFYNLKTLYITTLQQTMAHCLLFARFSLYSTCVNNLSYSSTASNNLSRRYQTYFFRMLNELEELTHMEPQCGVIYQIYMDCTSILYLLRFSHCHFIRT